MFLKLQSLTLLTWSLVGDLVSFVKPRHFLSQCSGKLKYLVYISVLTDHMAGKVIIFLMCKIKHYTMKAFGGMQVLLYALAALPLGNVPLVTNG
jgi:hypothetical protein